MQEEAQDVNAPAYFRTEEELRAPFLNADSPVRKAGLELVELKQQKVDCVARLVHLGGMCSRDRQISRYPFNLALSAFGQTYINASILKVCLLQAVCKVDLGLSGYLSDQVHFICYTVVPLSCDRSDKQAPLIMRTPALTLGVLNP